MSKSVYQILEHHTGAKSHNPHVITAMDEYAAQAVNEYKEKLKDEIMDLINEITVNMTDFKKGELSGLQTTIELL